MDADGNDQEGFFRKIDNLYKLRIAAERIATGAFQVGSRFVVSEQLIKQLHRTCMIGLLSDAGDYRTTNVEMLDDAPDGFLKTSDIIHGLEAYFRITGEDAEILENRSDTKFSQIVRNIVSHKTTSTNLIGAGLAIHDKAKKGLRITKEGREYLVAHQPLKMPT